MDLPIHKRVAVSCVTFETVKIVKPIQYLGSVDRVYLFHYQKPGVEKEERVYEKFYNEVSRQLDAGMHNCEILGIVVDVSDFKFMLRELIRVLRIERNDGNEIYINLSAGTSEYIAAATVASMMMEGVVPYTVATKTYTVKDEEVSVYFEDERPIGMSKEVENPQLLPTFHIEQPPYVLVEGLKILKDKKDKGHITTYPSLIEELKTKELWKRREKNKKPAKDIKQAEVMFFCRNFIDKWVERGWVSHDTRGILELTADGEIVTEIF